MSAASHYVDFANGDDEEVDKFHGGPGGDDSKKTTAVMMLMVTLILGSCGWATLVHGPLLDLHAAADLN